MRAGRGKAFGSRGIADYRRVHVSSPRVRAQLSAFTLLEMLVVVAVLTILLSILLPAMSGMRSSAKSLVCSSNLKSVGQEFTLFAQGDAPLGRGDSERLGPNRFRMNDFQESLYRLDEFWDGGEAETATLSGEKSLTMCPGSGAKQLTKRSGFPCGAAAVGPTEDVSVAFNMRLHRPVLEFKGRKVMAPVASSAVRTDVLHHAYVPLVMDVEGLDAAARGLEPFYIAPGIPDNNDPYAGGRFWMPSVRHQRKIYVAFVGGHVLTSPDPAGERWDWSYQAEAGR